MEFSRFSEAVRRSVEAGTAVPSGSVLWRMAPGLDAGDGPAHVRDAGTTVASDRVGRDVTISTDHRDRRGDIIESLGIDTGPYLTNPIVLWMHGRGTDYAVVGGNTKLSLSTVDGLPALRVDEFLFSDSDLARTVRSDWNDRILRAASIAVLPREWHPIDEAGNRLDPEDRRTAKLMRGVRITRSEMVEWSIVLRGADAKSLGRDWNPETERTRSFVDIGGETSGSVARTNAEEHERADGARYRSILAFAGSTPWACEPGVMLTIRDILAERAAGYVPTAEEVSERIGPQAEHARADAPQSGPVRVISIDGPIVPRAGMMERSSGLTSASAIRDEVRAAVADDAVRAIVLDIDSPGGAVSLVPELATAIRAAREVKRVVAVANTMAASAAYWIAASASKIVVSPSAEVGSIGVYNMHQDRSKMESNQGRKTTIVKAGPYKAEANPFEPLSDDAKAELQRKVDGYYSMFVEAVADGRGVAVDTVKEKFGGGRMLFARDAVRVGMADSVGTLDEVLSALEAEYAAPAQLAEALPPVAPDVAAVAADGHAGGMLRRTTLEQCPGCVAVAPYVRDANGKGGEFVFHRTRGGAECQSRRADVTPRGPSLRDVALLVRDALPQGHGIEKELPAEARELLLALAAAGQVGALPGQVARLVSAAGQVLQGRVLSAETRRLVEEALATAGRGLDESASAVTGCRETVGALTRLLTGAAPSADTRPVVASTPALRSALDRLTRAVK